MKAGYKHFIIIILGFILIGGFLLSRDDKTIGMIGEIVEISDSGQEEKKILVMGKDTNNSYDKAYVTINQRTLIYRGNSDTRISSDELNIGDSVEIIFKGGILESYPVQGVGDAVRIKE